MPRVIYGTTANNRAGQSCDYPFTHRRRIRIDRCDARSQLMSAGFTTHYPLSPLARGAMKTSRRAGGRRRAGRSGEPAAAGAQFAALGRQRPQLAALCFIPGNCARRKPPSTATTRPTVVDNCAIVARLRGD